VKAQNRQLYLKYKSQKIKKKSLMSSLSNFIIKVGMKKKNKRVKKKEKEFKNQENLQRVKRRS